MRVYTRECVKSSYRIAEKSKDRSFRQCQQKILPLQELPQAAIVSKRSDQRQPHQNGHLQQFKQRPRRIARRPANASQHHLPQPHKPEPGQDFFSCSSDA